MVVRCLGSNRLELEGASGVAAGRQAGESVARVLALREAESEAESRRAEVGQSGTAGFQTAGEGPLTVQRLANPGAARARTVTPVPGK